MHSCLNDHLGSVVVMTHVEYSVYCIWYNLQQAVHSTAGTSGTRSTRMFSNHYDLVVRQSILSCNLGGIFWCGGRACAVSVSEESVSLGGKTSWSFLTNTFLKSPVFVCS